MLILVRHGEANTEGTDANRTLTARGEAAAQRVAGWAVSAGFTVDEIRHSGKRRAEQTAETFARALGVADIKGVSGLSPNDDPDAMAAVLQVETARVMLVSHLPFLSRLVSLLLINDPDRVVVDFRPTTFVALSRQGTEWTIEAVVHPELIEDER